VRVFLTRFDGHLGVGTLHRVKIAARLRAETLMTVKWIAARLEMGTAGYVNNRLYRWRRKRWG